MQKEKIIEFSTVFHVNNDVMSECHVQPDEEEYFSLFHPGFAVQKGVKMNSGNGMVFWLIETLVLQPCFQSCYYMLELTSISHSTVRVNIITIIFRLMF